MTSDDPNPYSAPASAPPIPSAGPPPAPFTPPQPFYFRDGKFLVVRDGAELPEVCLRTNQPVESGGWRKKVPIVWTPPWVLLLFFVGGPLIYVIVAMATQKKAKFTYSLSAVTRGKVVRWRLLGFALLLAAVALVVLGINASDSQYIPYLVVGGIGALIACLVPFAIANPIKVGGFDNGWFKIKGCSPEFLDSLTHQPGGF